jgi:hypothetical protein
MLYKERRFSLRSMKTCRVWDPVTEAMDSSSVAEGFALVQWLGGRSFMMVPLRHHQQFSGYLFISATRRNAFQLDDAKFLLQLADHVRPVLEHIRLVEHMASEGAAEERRRIVRNINDAARISKPKEDLLMESLQRYAAKFEVLTGIHTTVINRLENVKLDDPLNLEIFQMAAEALNNAYRHTSADSVILTMTPTATGGVAVGFENADGRETDEGEMRRRSPGKRASSVGTVIW